MDFSSDTSAPAHPRVLAALAQANAGPAASYGGDSETARLEARLKAVFETDALRVWPVASGTASNALALSCLCPPTHSILCHREAHIERDERGAPEFFSGGAKLRLMDGAHGRIEAPALAGLLAGVDPAFVHETPPAALSLTNLTECGTLYGPDALAELSAVAHTHGLSVHLDGARFANALVALSCTPAALSWQAGVDVLTLGLTKTGAMGCELIVLFGAATSYWDALRARAKRSGHMPPKLRFFSAQACAMLEDDLWLELAASANARASALAQVFVEAGQGLRHPAEGNEVFADLDPRVATALSEAGARFYPWPDGSHRFVCSWTTTGEEIDTVQAVLARAIR